MHSFPCPSCNYQLPATPQNAGLTGPCPSCNTLVQVPYSNSPNTFQRDRSAGEEELRGTAPSSKDFDFDRACLLVKSKMQSQPFFTPLSDAMLEVKEKIGEGGMGAVYRVFDKRLEREAALKLLLSNEESNADLRLRFVREAKITARLDHPGIPPIYDAGENSEGQCFLLMRLISGDTMTSRIRSYHKSKNSEHLISLLDALARTAEAVAHAHNRQIIHRDLKPENIMIGEFGEVLVMDWGLARALRDRDADIEDESLRVKIQELQGRELPSGEADLTQVGSVIGTPGYMPPEQADGDTVDERSDVFALGAILCEILTNSPPIRGSTSLNKIVATIKGDIQTPMEIEAAVPPELQSLASIALKGEADERMRSAAEFLADLKAYQSGGRLRSHQYSLRERFVRSVRSNATACVSVMSVLLMITLIGGAGLLLREAKRTVAETRQQKETEVNAEKGRTESQQKAYEMGLAAFEELNEVLVLRYRPLGTEDQEIELIESLNSGIERALEKLERALTTDESLPALHILQARAFLRANRYKSAKLSVEKAINLDPDSGEAWRLKGRILSESLGFEFLDEELGVAGHFEFRIAQIEKCFERSERLL
ncbi:MAG: protein kinase, partial [Planctomycetota bacterium]|nr:protein kinase [Planctomycetota bacterium]